MFVHSNGSKNLFMFKSVFPFYINMKTITFFLVVETALSTDWHFDACKTQNCGRGPDIRFPFWIEGVQESFCGYPGFNVSCKNREPTYNMSGDEFFIREIDRENESLLLTRERPWDNPCSPLIHNLTFSHTPFMLGPDQVSLVLLFNCTASLPDEYLRYSIGCDAQNSSHRFLAVFSHDPQLNYVKQSGKCETSVIIPVDMSDKESLDRITSRDQTVEILTKGFQLRWNASKCSKCEGSGGHCGFNWTMYTFNCFCPDRPHSNSCPSHSKRRITTIIIVGASAILATLVVISCILTRKFFSNKLMLFSKKKTGSAQNVEAFLMNYGSLSPGRYKYSDIKKMTNSFKHKLGQGGYGSVYKGKLLNERMVAVKLLSESTSNGEEFINEVASISRTSHINVVTLIGFCVEGNKRALIYEFMPNGSLEKFIYNKINPHHLGWKTLYDIALGIGRGLEYLHRGCNTRILHFDIKPHNILLDQNFCPKISDFGLSKLCLAKESIISMTGARGTIGYIAPELISRNFGAVSHKSDVYSYGMMVLEIVGGRKNDDARAANSSQIYFPEWVYNHLDQSRDLGLQGVTTPEDEEILRKMVLVGLWCIQIDPSNRPPINKVLDMLEGSLEELQIPPRPFFSSLPRPQEDISTISISSSSRP